MILESCKLDGICSFVFNRKVLDGFIWEDIRSCPLLVFPVVTKRSLELLFEGSVNVGIDEGHDTWRCIETGLCVAWCISLTRICVGCWIGVDDDAKDDEVVNNGLTEDVKPWGNEYKLFLVFVDEGNEADTPEEETRLGDVENDDDDAVSDVAVE